MSTGDKTSGGEGGIRTPGTGVSPYNGLANRRLQPLGHLSGKFGGTNLVIVAADGSARDKFEKAQAVPPRNGGWENSLRGSAISQVQFDCGSNSKARWILPRTFT